MKTNVFFLIFSYHPGPLSTTGGVVSGSTCDTWTALDFFHHHRICPPVTHGHHQKKYHRGSGVAERQRKALFTYIWPRRPKIFIIIRHHRPVARFCLCVVPPVTTQARAFTTASSSHHTEHQLTLQILISSLGLNRTRGERSLAPKRSKHKGKLFRVTPERRLRPEPK